MAAAEKKNPLDIVWAELQKKYNSNLARALLVSGNMGHVTYAQDLLKQRGQLLLQDALLLIERFGQPDFLPVTLKEHIAWTCTTFPREPDAHLHSLRLQPAAARGSALLLFSDACVAECTDKNNHRALLEWVRSLADLK